MRLDTTKRTAAAALDAARQQRNRVYFDWLAGASDDDMRQRLPVFDIEVPTLQERERRMYQQHLQLWLEHHQPEPHQQRRVIQRTPRDVAQ
jgi:hypothetical protein